MENWNSVCCWIASMGSKEGGGSPERFEWTVKDLRMEGDGCIQLISFLVTLTDYLQCSVTENLFSLPFKMALPNAQKFYMYESKSTRSLYPDCSDSSGPGIKVERRFTAHIFLLTLWKINYVSHWPKNLNTPYCNFFALSKIQMWSIYFIAKLLLCKRFFWELKRWCHHNGPRKENPQISQFPGRTYSKLFAYCWCLSWKEESSI